MRGFRSLIGLSLLSLGLAGCATAQLNPGDVQQNLSSDMQKQWNHVLNTANDNQPQVWQAPDDKTRYELTTSNTKVNSAGEPCRNFTLVIDREYHRKQSTQGVACRQGDGWQVIA